jgi:hypothetical protein
MYKIVLRSAVCAAALILAACSEAPKSASKTEEAEKKEPARPPEPVSAKTAFWEMYTSARSWATDLQPLKIDSKEVPGIKNDGGKAGMWEVTFGSPSKHEYRVYSYAVVAAPPEIYKGVAVGRSLPWGGSTRDVMAFPTSELAVDSDAAYKTASVQAAPWLKQHPDKKASIQLWDSYRYETPVWYVLWGDKKLGYGVFVNAKTGAAIKNK